MKIWLDDVRPAPDGWTHVLTAEEVISILETTEVDEISLDNDLGYSNMTGSELIEWMERELSLNLRMPPKTIHVHTGCPRAERHMLVVRDRIYAKVKALKIQKGE